MFKRKPKNKLENQQTKEERKKIRYIGKRGNKINMSIVAEMKKKLKEKEKSLLKKDIQQVVKNGTFTLSADEKKISGIDLEQTKKDLTEKEKHIDTALKKDEKEDEGYDPIDNTEKDGETIEKAVSVAIEGLSNPKDVRHFSDINKHQAYHISLGIALCDSLNFENPKEIFTQILHHSISAGRKGRTELKDVGVAGVSRESQNGIMDRMRNWRGQN